MKNIHVLPTDKPSRLFLNRNNYTFFLNEQFDYGSPKIYAHNIYITSENKDINENDYIITKDCRLVQVSYLLSKDLEGASNVILTTDQELIKDGVQAIDDEFLEWFVKNPSCDSVDVEYFVFRNSRLQVEYEIIIPSEEPKDKCCEDVNGFYLGTTCPKCNKPFRSIVKKPKQETLEEAFKNTYLGEKISFNSDIGKSFEIGANWQAERMYSEEDMKDYALKCVKTSVFNGDFISDNLKEHIVQNNNKQFEEFKNK